MTNSRRHQRPSSVPTYDPPQSQNSANVSSPSIPADMKHATSDPLQDSPAQKLPAARLVSRTVEGASLLEEREGGIKTGWNIAEVLAVSAKGCGKKSSRRDVCRRRDR